MEQKLPMKNDNFSLPTFVNAFNDDELNRILKSNVCESSVSSDPTITLLRNSTTGRGYCGLRSQNILRFLVEQYGLIFSNGQYFGEIHGQTYFVKKGCICSEICDENKCPDDRGRSCSGHFFNII